MSSVRRAKSDCCDSQLCRTAGRNRMPLLRRHRSPPAQPSTSLVPEILVTRPSSLVLSESAGASADGTTSSLNRSTSSVGDSDGRNSYADSPAPEGEMKNIQHHHQHSPLTAEHQNVQQLSNQQQNSPGLSSSQQQLHQLHHHHQLQDQQQLSNQPTPSHQQQQQSQQQQSQQQQSPPPQQLSQQQPAVSSNSPTNMQWTNSPTREPVAPVAPVAVSVAAKSSKSNERFHRLFKRLPDDEVLLNSYSCAYFGDILLHGNLYVSANWFCFHSKILAIGKQLEIPISRVQRITREKTALFIPNAVGIQTSDSRKYVFGSLMSRDNTYRLLDEIWKCYSRSAELPMLKTPRQSIEFASDGSNVQDKDSVEELIMQPSSVHPNLESSDSSYECQQCGGASSPVSTLPANAKSDRSTGTADVAVRSRHRSLSTKSNTTQLPDKASSSSFLYHFYFCRRNSLLSMCIVLSSFLTISALIMAYKIVQLQNQVDKALNKSSMLPWFESPEASEHYLKGTYHAANIKRLHTVLQANIHILEKVYSSLENLDVSIDNTKNLKNIKTPDQSESVGEENAPFKPVVVQHDES